MAHLKKYTNENLSYICEELGLVKSGPKDALESRLKGKFTANAARIFEDWAGFVPKAGDASKAELQGACMQHDIPKTGNVANLALRLAMAGIERTKHVPKPAAAAPKPAASELGLQLMLVNVPANVKPGDQMVVMTPQGQQHMVVVPQGAKPGTQFQIAVPRAEMQEKKATAPVAAAPKPKPVPPKPVPPKAEKPKPTADKENGVGFATNQKGAKKVALVVGICKYKSAPLKNPVNDAKAIAAMFKTMGFAVTLVLDCAEAALSKAVRAFTDGLSTDVSSAVFFFAGHGCEYQNQNYVSRSR